jgi:hypothetical protein
MEIEYSTTDTANSKIVKRNTKNNETGFIEISTIVATKYFCNFKS